MNLLSQILRMDNFETTNATYYKKLFFKIAMILVIVGGINWLFVGMFDMNLVKNIFGSGMVANTIYILVGLSAITIMFDRDTYLPFLGPTVAPCSVLDNRAPPGATRDVTVTVKPHSKVLYWAAEPATEKLKSVNDFKKAYADYQNAGVTVANADGVAILKIREPQPYKVPIMGTLKPHVHYRVCGESGWMGRINTAFLESQKVEGFESECSLKKDAGYKFRDYSSSIF